MSYGKLVQRNPRRKLLSVGCLSTADKAFRQRFVTSPECMKILDP